MLIIFALCSLANSLHWLQFSIIANIMTRYYDVNNLTINWTSIVYEASYMPFVFPASWLLQAKVKLV
ncbi:Feline leukemia virus subgroup C receptor-related protein 1 [Blattella germanica]|nr:Feline leukemia virus subgroup C receptor-related protein 1 [Blattella germanica]